MDLTLAGVSAPGYNVRSNSGERRHHFHIRLLRIHSLEQMITDSQWITREKSFVAFGTVDRTRTLLVHQFLEFFDQPFMAFFIVLVFTGNRMLAIPTCERLRRALANMLDENEFFSPYGVRSVSQYHRDHPYISRAGNEDHRVDYVPGEGTSYSLPDGGSVADEVCYRRDMTLVPHLVNLFAKPTIKAKLSMSPFEPGGDRKQIARELRDHIIWLRS